MDYKILPTSRNIRITNRMPGDNPRVLRLLILNTFDIIYLQIEFDSLSIPKVIDCRQCLFFIIT